MRNIENRLTESDVQNLEVIDRLLSDLDRLSKSETSPTRFYRELLDRMNSLLGCNSACLVNCVYPGRWDVLATTDKTISRAVEECLVTLAKTNESGILDQWIAHSGGFAWFGQSLRRSSWTSGGIVVCFCESGPPAIDSKEIFELTTAFAEIVSNYQAEHRLAHWEKQLSEIREVVRAILESKQVTDANQLLADSVRCLIEADRVSLIDPDSLHSGRSIQAISGTQQINSQSNFSLALNRLTKSIKKELPTGDQLRQFMDETGSSFSIAVPTKLPKNRTAHLEPNSQKSLLVIEWLGVDRYSDASPRLQTVIPWLLDAWNFRTRQASHRQAKSFQLRSFGYALTVFGCILFLLFKTELVIHSNGTLQPIEQRFLFAPSDGYVEKIHVADGQRVHKGDMIVSLVSPTLELQMNQIVSDIGLVNQKRTGLNIAINQIQSSDNESELAGSRLAGEVLELDTKYKNLLQQKLLVRRELDRLELRSPIDGIIVAWEVEKYLENRPVRRGETLIRICALDDQCQFELTVSDWESGYLLQAYDHAISEEKQISVMYVLSSEPSIKRSGRVKTIGKTMIADESGQQLQVLVEPDGDIPNGRLGTSVNVSIPCGSYSRWFVWTRSILDACHRRFWL